MLNKNTKVENKKNKRIGKYKYCKKMVTKKNIRKNKMDTKIQENY